MIESRRVSRVGALLCLGIVSATSAALAECPANAEAGSTWVVFASFRRGDFSSSVHAVRPDGSEECQISVHPGGRPSTLDPTVSPDGKQIAFARGDSGHRTSIWTMRVDGTGERELAKDVILRFRKGWAAPVHSPSGRRIAFTADGRGKKRVIRVMNADGSAVTELGSGTFPAWSPDGTRIAFTDTAGTDEQSAVWAMRADGSDRRRLTSDAPSAYPSWSPDGTEIVFSRQVGEALDLYLVKSDGSKPRALTRTPERSEAHPSWSPDGDSIAFTARSPDAPDGWQNSVFVIPASGGEARQITPAKFNDLSPSWFVVPRQQGSKR